MTIHETKMIIRRWCFSCETCEQLDTLKGAIKLYFIPNLRIELMMNFGSGADGLMNEVKETEAELLEGIEIRKKVLATPSLHPAEHSNTIGRNNRLNELP
jgi:hypothetical protein